MNVETIKYENNTISHFICFQERQYNNKLWIIMNYTKSNKHFEIIHKYSYDF